MAQPIYPPVGGDVSRAGTLDAVDWSLTGLAIIFVGCRLFTRLKIIHNPGWDDVFITLSIVLNIITVSFTTAANANGMGRHAYYLSPEQLTRAVKLNIIGQPFGIMAYCVPKLAVALLIIRLMPPAKPGKWFLYLITISLIILSAVAAILLFVQCSPPEALWNPTISFHCWPPSILSNYTFFVGAYSAFCDLCLAIFPISIFWKLQLPRKKVVGICCVMGLGVFASVCAIIKTTKLNELQDHSDFTWATVDLLLWTVVESNVIIICACVPTLRPLISYIRGKDLGSIFRATTNKSNTRTGVTERMGLNQYQVIDKNVWNDSHSKRSSPTDEGDMSTNIELQQEIV